ncbi:hypothetical protein [Priestia megaterium]|uniref:hypothetical protein n=1 Tax=Priestia megaterium TaxID=1404 RepID=UPI0028590373|nr:hypothetical protein [Priestia megaterium]MDR7246976.1 putative membrane protein YkgB [Priestia megaterium]
MLVLKLLLIILGMFSYMYNVKFQSSPEGKDERGIIIQSKTNSYTLGAFYISISILIVLNLLNLVDTNALPSLLLYFFISISILSSLISLVYRRKV